MKQTPRGNQDRDGEEKGNDRQRINGWQSRHPFANFIAGRQGMIKKHRTLLIALFILLLACLRPHLPVAMAVSQYYATEKHQCKSTAIASTSSMAMIQSSSRPFLKITQPDGKSAEAMQTIRHVDARG